jgi:hypothetical protein
MFKKLLRHHAIASHVIPASLLALGIAVGGLAIGHAISTYQSFNRFVTVKGFAENIVKADEGHWQISFTYADDDLAKLYQGIAGAQTKAKIFLLGKGFKDKEISFGSVSITDNQNNSYTTNTNVKHYTASETINLNTTQVDLIKETMQTLSSLVQKGIVITNTSIQYHFTKLKRLKPDMLVSATQNAKKAAEIFAENSHSKLGGIKKATQGLFTICSAGPNSYDDSNLMKKVRVVTTVDYFLK